MFSRFSMFSRFVATLFYLFSCRILMTSSNPHDDDIIKNFCQFVKISIHKVLELIPQNFGSVAPLGWPRLIGIVGQGI